MSGIVGFVFLVTISNCVFGLLDQMWQALVRRYRARKAAA